MNDELLVAREARGIVRLTLNRADKRNALTRALLEQLLAALREVRDDASARLLILDAAGPTFCAGMDLAEMQARAGDPQAAALWQQDAERFHDVLVALLDLPCPALAVLQGPVLAGGVGLVLACDLVLAAQPAWFGLPEPKRGITASLVTPLLVHRGGAGTAAYLLLSGKQITAVEAYRLGLVHQVCAADGLPTWTADLTRSILEGGPGALAATKQFLRECGSGPALRDELLQAVGRSAAARRSDEAREGLAAFLEKRPAHWQSADRVG